MAPFISSNSTKNNNFKRIGLSIVSKTLVFLMMSSLFFFNGPSDFIKTRQVKAWVGSPLIIDHASTNITAIPQVAITSAKSNLHIVYGHTSHGSQLIDGMNGLIAFANNGGKGLSLPQNIFAWNNGGTGGALDLHDGGIGGDVGYYPQWVNNTRSYLGTPNPATGRGTGANADVNVVIWSWCGQASGYTEQQMIDNYLAPMSQLELDYPGITFVYMTGHLDGTGTTGNLHARNEQIRAYCRANNKVLYDFNDIESYDPDGLVNYNSLRANDNCDYDSDGNGSLDRNWATVWQNSHTENVDWYYCGAQHSQPLNANQKAYAAWYLWARLGGWNGEPIIPVPLAVNPSIRTVNANQLNLSWGLDRVGSAVSYEIYRNGQMIGTTEDTFYADIGLSPSTQYSYYVLALNVGGQRSVQGRTVTASTLATHIQGQTYHVSPSGSDTADGSAAHPWRTLSYAVSQMPGGNRLVVHEGTYNEEGLIPADGSQEYWTVIEGAEGENMPIIDAGHIPPADGSQMSGSTPIFNLRGANWVRISGLDMRNCVQSIIRIGDEPDFSTQIIVENSRFSGVIWSDNTANIYLASGWRNVIIRNCAMTGNRQENINYCGIQLFRGNGTLEISNCDISDASMGIFWKHGGTGQYEAVIKDNFLHNNVTHGISLSNDNTTISNNLVINNNTGIKVYGTGGFNKGDNNRIIHNTVYNNRNSISYYNGDGDGAEDNVLKDNIISGYDNAINEYAIWPDSTDAWSTKGNVSDYNVYWNNDGSDIIACVREKFTLSEWRQRTLMDAHSVNQAPIFVNASGYLNDLNDFILAAGSPGKNVASDGADMGADISSIGYSGQSPVDTGSPSVPTDLSATASSSSEINLTWTASTDNVAVVGYRVYRNGTQIATTTATNYSNTGLSPATQYSYTVSAFDAARNFSSQSGSASVTTQSLSSNPVIGSVSGMISDNQTITISGSGFGTKATAKPILWADFSSDINPSNLGQRTSWDDAQNLFSTTTLPVGAGTSNGVVGTWTGDPYKASFSFGVNKNYWTKVYVYAKRYFDFDTTTNQKFFRINPNPVINANDPVAAYHKGLWLTFLNEGDDDNPDRFCTTPTCLNGYTKNQWMREEFIWQYSGGSGLNANGTVGAGSGIVDYTRDGVRVHHQENINNGANTQSDLRMLDNFTPDNIPTDTPPNGSHVYMTDMYADDTYSRVMIGNASTLASSTHREIFIPYAWSNTSVSVTVNQGTFISGDTAYLFVVNASNTPSVGYRITIGVATSSDVTPPTGSVSINSGASYAKSSSTVLSLIASDVSGVTQMKLSDISTNFASLAALTFSTTYSWTLLGAEGVKNVYAWFKDALGNWNSSPYSDSIILDTKFPSVDSVSVSDITGDSVTINYVNDELTVGYINYGLSSDYTASTTRETIYLSDHAINIANLSASTTYDYQIVVVDRAGNKSLSINRQFTTIDSDTPDIVAPGKITNLLSGSVSQSGAVLTWSAPGDDNNTGFASSYELKYSTASLANNATEAQADSWWALATGVTGEPAPRQAGTVENLTLAGLSASTRYYVAIRSVDEVGNISSTSNIASFVTSAPASTPSSGGGGGGGSSSGGGGGGTTPGTSGSGSGNTVVAPSSFTAIGAKGQILLNWQNPTSQDFVKVKIFRKLNISPSSPTDATAVLVYEGTAQQFIDTGLENGLIYYYALYSYDRSLNPSAAKLASAKTDASKETVSANETERGQTATEQNKTTTSSSARKSLVGVKSSEVDSITKQEAQELNSDPKLVPLDEATYNVYKKIVALSKKELSTGERYVIARFVHYGTPTTIVNGAGERGGSIASFNSAFGRLPKTETDWQDVIKIANGRWPTQKNTVAEKKSQTTTFAKVYGRTADMNNTNDNAAVTVMTYGLRPALRNTDSEKNGILAFKYYYKRAPSSAEDWDIVRAIAYSGAKR